MKEIYRWRDGEDVHEYRFMDNVCTGFFSNGKEQAKPQKYKGRSMTDAWLSNLPKAGFKLVTNY